MTEPATPTRRLPQDGAAEAALLGLQCLELGYDETGETAEKVTKAQGMESGVVEGVPLPYAALRSLCGSFRPGELVVVAGRPSMGKSALALCPARRAAPDCRALYFSLEMGRDSLVERLLAAECGVSAHALPLPHGDRRAIPAGPGGRPQPPGRAVVPG